MKPQALHPAPAYLRCFAAQVGALGAAGQHRLQRASVLIAGAGGLGTAVLAVIIRLIPALLQMTWQVLPGILVLWMVVAVLRSLLKKLLE